MTATQGDPVKLPFISHPRTVGLFAVVTVAATVSAFLIGGSISTTGDKLEDASTVEIPVSATVEQRSVAVAPSYTGAISAGRSLDIAGFIPEGANARVVVSVELGVGDAVQFGKSLGEVSGRPLIAMRSSLPLFRNLTLGVEGADVLAIQESLNSAGFISPVTGRMDMPTLFAVRKLYESAGYREPGWPNLPFVDTRELVTVDADSPVVEYIAAAGSILSDSGVFAKLRVSPDFVSARVGVIDEPSFALGSDVRITGPDGFRAEAKVTHVSEFRPGTEAQPAAGFDIEIALESSDLPPRTSPVTVSAIVNETLALAVPLIAIRQESGRTFIQPAFTGGSIPDLIEVSVIAQSDGWAAIVADDPRVKEGLEIVIR